MKSESKRKKGEEKLFRSFLHFLYRNKDNKNLLPKIIERVDFRIKEQFEGYYIQEIVEYVLSVCLHPSLDLNFYKLYSSFKGEFDPVVQSRGISSEVMLKAILRTAKTIHRE